jgi:prevent-host-death family protein
MKSVTAHAANQAFSKLLDDVEHGETVLITRDGKAVAEIRPPAPGPAESAAWRAAFDRMTALMAAWPESNSQVGKITIHDKYGDRG